MKALSFRIKLSIEPLWALTLPQINVLTQRFYGVNDAEGGTRVLRAFYIRRTGLLAAAISLSLTFTWFAAQITSGRQVSAGMGLTIVGILGFVAFTGCSQQAAEVSGQRDSWLAFARELATIHELAPATYFDLLVGKPEEVVQRKFDERFGEMNDQIISAATWGYKRIGLQSAERSRLAHAANRFKFSVLPMPKPETSDVTVSTLATT
jgi:hypothetical protein